MRKALLSMSLKYQARTHHAHVAIFNYHKALDKYRTGTVQCLNYLEDSVKNGDVELFLLWYSFRKNRLIRVFPNERELFNRALQSGNCRMLHAVVSVVFHKNLTLVEEYLEPKTWYLAISRGNVRTAKWLRKTFPQYPFWTGNVLYYGAKSGCDTMIKYALKHARRYFKTHDVIELTQDNFTDANEVDNPRSFKDLVMECIYILSANCQINALKFIIDQTRILPDSFALYTCAFQRWYYDGKTQDQFKTYRLLKSYGAQLNPTHRDGLSKKQFKPGELAELLRQDEGFKYFPSQDILRNNDVDQFRIVFDSVSFSDWEVERQDFLISLVVDYASVGCEFPSILAYLHAREPAALTRYMTNVYRHFSRCRSNVHMIRYVQDHFNVLSNIPFNTTFEYICDGMMNVNHARALLPYLSTVYRNRYNCDAKVTLLRIVIHQWRREDDKDANDKDAHAEVVKYIASSIAEEGPRAIRHAVDVLTDDYFGPTVRYDTTSWPPEILELIDTVDDLFKTALLHAGESY